MALFLVTDIVLITLGIPTLSSQGTLSNRYDLTIPNSFAANFQLAKWMVMIMAVVLMALYQQEKKYFTWILVAFFLLLEDLFQIHRSLGAFLYNVLGMTTGKKGSTLMEIFAALFLSFIFTAPAIEAYKKAGLLFRKHSAVMFILLGLFLFFSLVLKQVHQIVALPGEWKYDNILNVVMQAGALLTASMISGYWIQAALRHKIAGSSVAGH